MITLLLGGLVSAAEPTLESDVVAGGDSASPYQRGYDAGFAAAEAAPRGRPGLVGFAAGFGTAALGTTLVGPCLASPCIVGGAMTTPVIYSAQKGDPPESEETWQYSSGYRHGWTDASLPNRVRPALLGGLAGAVVGTAGAYLAVGFAYERMGYDTDAFPFR